MVSWKDTQIFFAARASRRFAPPRHQIILQNQSWHSKLGCSSDCRCGHIASRANHCFGTKGANVGPRFAIPLEQCCIPANRIERWRGRHFSGGHCLEWNAGSGNDLHFHPGGATDVEQIS